MNTARTVRRRILQVANDLYLHAISDRHMRESLRRFAMTLTVREIRREYDYLGGVADAAGIPALAVARIDDDLWTARITPAGVDLLTGAAAARGIRGGDPVTANLPYQKELRRGILAELSAHPGRFVEDVDLRERFVTGGFVSVELPEVQYHLWYLAQKGYLELRQISFEMTRNVTARITSRGIDLIANDLSDPGVSADDD